MKTIDYYMSPGSPWTYLGHARLVEIAKRHGVIFPQSGGLPLPKRAPQRQAYRLVELKRWQEHLGVPICAAAAEKRMALAGELLAALWKVDRHIADAAVLDEIGARHGVPTGDKTQYDAYTQDALGRGVFGAPSCVYRDEIFWGQDRLDFLERALKR